MDPGKERFERLRATATFAGEAHDRWRQCRIAVVGLGAIGGHVAREAVRSGARCDLYDFDVGSHHNGGNQDVEVGEAKAVTTARICNAMTPGSVQAFVVDVRHVGPGAFEGVDVIMDCSDDPALALPITELSNGWRVPLIRMAVDGSGSRELGRVLVSDGGRGGACQLCASSWKEVFDPGPRTPCVGTFPDRPPTNAGAPLAMTVAGLGLLTAQRLVGGKGVDAVTDREQIVDLDTPQILPMRIERNPDCLSGHRSWAPLRLRRTAAETTVGDLMTLTEEALGMGSDAAGARSAIALSVHGHSLLLAASCPACGHGEVHPGTLWTATPPCRGCGHAMQRRRDTAITRIHRSQIDALGLAATTCEALGLPRHGALVFGRAPGREPVQLLFD